MKQIAAIPALTPPVNGDNLYVLSATTTVSDFLIPRRWMGGAVTIHADTCDLYLMFGKIGDAMNFSAGFSLVDGANNLTAQGGEAWKIPNGTSVTFDFSQLRDRLSQGDVTAMIYDCSNSTGRIRMLVSSGQAGTINE